MTSSPRIIHALFPDLLYENGSFHPDRGLLVEDQSIAAVLSLQDLEREVERRRQQGQYVTSRRLAGKALMPGLVNTHSHAFQRGIRGRTEFPGGTSGTEDFWSWRGVMYATADRLSPEDVEALALGVYVEMVKAGITHVGEFHYLHHQPDGTPYDDPDELAWRILRASRGAGLRLTMLRSYYQRAGVGRPQPEGAQRRFCDPNLDFYLTSLQRLAQSGCHVAVTPHSVRAVPGADIERLAEYANQQGWPLHLHISEQPKEVDECLEEYQCRPVELLERLGGLGPSTTLVHAIHLTPAEVKAVGNAGCSIASCPTTERNLGDGIVPAEALLSAGARFTFGTDSQCQITPFEDARQLEYHRRLEAKKRALLYPDHEKASAGLVEMLTINGWRSLGQTGGLLTAGQPSDMVAVDLNHLSVAGWSPSSLALDLIFAATPDVVSDVWVGGIEVVCERFHRAQEQASVDLARVLKKLRQS